MIYPSTNIVWYTNLKKIRSMTDFSSHFRKVIMCYKRIGYNLNAVACLVINPIMVDSFDALFNCMPVDRRQTLCWPDLKLLILVSLERSFRLLLGPPGLN